MYGFEPTEEQQMLVDTIQKFAAKDLRQAAHEADEQGGFPADVVRRGWELGVLQASIPEAYGGFGERSAVTGVLALEELAYGDPAGALAILAPATYAVPVLLAGTEEQKKALLPPVIEGDWKPYTAAFLEPDFDFDPGEMRTVAERVNGGYVLKGAKTMVPFADGADGMLVYAACEGRTQAFVVSPKAEGVVIDGREKHLGLGAVPLFGVRFEDVRLAREARLGGADGHDPAPLLAAAGTAAAAVAVGLSRAAYEYALRYAKEREVFGTPIAQKQSIAFMLAEMAIEIEAIRLLVWEAAWMADVGKDASKAAYLAHTGAGDMAMRVTDGAVQILGGHGYIREHPVERWYRTGRGVPLFAGLSMV